MKRIFFLLIVFSLLATWQVVTAADSTWYFFGGRADYKPGLVLKVNFGSAFPAGNHIYVIPNFDVGSTDTIGSRMSSGNLDFSWNPVANNIGAIHVLLGGNLDWVSQPAGNALTYLNAAIGGFGVLHLRAFLHPKSGPIGWFTERFSVYVSWKYKTDFDSKSRFPAGNQFGIGLTVPRALLF